MRAYWILGSRVLLATLGLAASATPAEYAERLERVGTVEYPHGWTVGWVKQGDYLFQTAGETAKKLRVIDATDPAKLKVVAKAEIAHEHAAWQLRLNGNMLLCNLYQYFVPVDISDPLRPRTVLGCEWYPQPAGGSWYGYQWHGDYLYLTAAEPKLAFRVYRVEGAFRPRLLATLSMEDLAFRLAGTVLSESDILDWKGFVSRLRNYLKSTGDTPGKAIMRSFQKADELDALTLEPDAPLPDLSEIPDDPNDAFKTRMVKALNQVLNERSFYDPRWEVLDLSERAKQAWARKPILDCGSQDVFRLNRIVLEAAFPYEVKTPLTSLLYDGGGGGGLTLDGTLAHTRRGLYRIGIDVSNPAQPTVAYAATAALRGKVESEARAGDVSYVTTVRYSTKRASWNKQLYRERTPKSVLALSGDWRKSEKPVVVGEYREMEMPSSVLTHSNVLFVLGMESIPPADRNLDGVPFGSGLNKSLRYRPVMHAVDVSNPKQMTRTFLHAFPARAISDDGDLAGCLRGVLDGSLLYVNDIMYGIWVFDIHEPNRPSLKGQWCATSRETPGALLKADRLYALGSLGMLPVDVSDPTNPRLLGGVSLGPALTDLQYAVPPACERFKYMYIPAGLSGDIVVYDATDAARPRVVNIVTVPGAMAAAVNLFETEEFLYVLSSAEQHREFFFLAYRKGAGGDLRLASQLPLPVGGNIPWWGADGGRGAPILCPAGDRAFVVLNRDSLGRADSEQGKTPLVLFTIGLAQGDSPRLLGMSETEPVRSAVRRNSQAVYYRGYLYTAGTADAKAGPDESEDGPAMDIGLRRDGDLEQQFAVASAMPLPAKDAAGASKLRRACLFVFDTQEPNNVKLVNTCHFPWGMHMCSDLTVLSPFPCIAVQDYPNGLTLLDLRDPVRPDCVWKEPPRTGYDFENYGRISWSSGVFCDGLLYRSGLDHLDIFKLVVKDGDRPDRGTFWDDRRKALQTMLAQEGSAPQHKAVLQVALKCLAYYESENPPQAGIETAEELSRLAENGFNLAAVIGSAWRARGRIAIDGDAAEWQGLLRLPFAQGPATACFQWDATNLYVLFEVKDDRIDIPPNHDPTRSMGDYIHLALSALPCPQDRPYRMPDLACSVPFDSTSFRIENGRRKPVAGAGRCAWKRTAVGYCAELSLSHEETWIVPEEGAVITCQLAVTDSGMGRWFLRPARWSRFDFVAGLPCIRFAGAAEAGKD